VASGATPRLARRTFLAGAAGLSLSAALAALPRALDARGWLNTALAAEADLTRDTMNGLVAFITPGNDEYSVAQEAAFEGTGGIGGGTTSVLIKALDEFVPTPIVGGPAGSRVPISAAIAEALNHYATQVNPAAARGAFISHFSRLSYMEKGEVFRLFESDPAWEDNSVRYLAGILPGFVASITFSEAAFTNPDGTLRETPLGWKISKFSAPNDGWKEFQGYWEGHRSAVKAHRYVRAHGRNGGKKRA
jgi:hypothetical protein